MTALEKLQWLQENAYSLSIEFNEHRNYYQKLVNEIAGERSRYRFPSKEIETECVRRDQLVALQVYPATPIGFVVFLHFDASQAIEAAFDWLQRDRGIQ